MNAPDRRRCQVMASREDRAPQPLVPIAAPSPARESEQRDCRCGRAAGRLGNAEGRGGLEVRATSVLELEGGFGALIEVAHLERAGSGAGDQPIASVRERSRRAVEEVAKSSWPDGAGGR